MPSRPVRLAPDDYVLCNCADCGRELWGAAMARLGHPASDALPPGVQMLAGRVGGRPYCGRCLHPPRPETDPYDQVMPDPSPEVWKS